MSDVVFKIGRSRKNAVVIGRNIKVNRTGYEVRSTISHVKLGLGSRITSHIIKHPIYAVIVIYVLFFSDIIRFNHVLIGEFLCIHQQLFNIIVYWSIRKV